MNLINKNKSLIVIILPILILILFRSFGSNHFKGDAKRWSQPSLVHSNIITFENMSILPGEKLIINLNDKEDVISDLPKDALRMPGDSILIRKNLGFIRNHKGPVLLFSSETGVSVRIWMLLSQMGCKDIFVLTSHPDSEVFKKQFRPDTLVRPEL
jgi:hypothetical protein